MRNRRVRLRRKTFLYIDRSFNEIENKTHTHAQEAKETESIDRLAKLHFFFLQNK